MHPSLWILTLAIHPGAAGQDSGTPGPDPSDPLRMEMPLGGFTIGRPILDEVPSDVARVSWAPRQGNAGGDVENPQDPRRGLLFELEDGTILEVTEVNASHVQLALALLAGQPTGEPLFQEFRDTPYGAIGLHGMGDSIPWWSHDPEVDAIWEGHRWNYDLHPALEGWYQGLYVASLTMSTLYPENWIASESKAIDQEAKDRIHAWASSDPDAWRYRNALVGIRAIDGAPIADRVGASAEGYDAEARVRLFLEFEGYRSTDAGWVADPDLAKAFRHAHGDLVAGAHAWATINYFAYIFTLVQWAWQDDAEWALGDPVASPEVDTGCVYLNEESVGTGPGFTRPQAVRELWAQADVELEKIIEGAPEEVKLVLRDAMKDFDRLDAIDFEIAEAKADSVRAWQEIRALETRANERHRAAIDRAVADRARAQEAWNSAWTDSPEEAAAERAIEKAEEDYRRALRRIPGVKPLLERSEAAAERALVAEIRRIAADEGLAGEFAFTARIQGLETDSLRQEQWSRALEDRERLELEILAQAEDPNIALDRYRFKLDDATVEALPSSARLNYRGLLRTYRSKLEAHLLAHPGSTESAFRSGPGAQLLHDMDALLERHVDAADPIFEAMQVHRHLDAVRTQIAGYARRHFPAWDRWWYFVEKRKAVWDDIMGAD